MSQSKARHTEYMRQYKLKNKRYTEANKKALKAISERGRNFILVAKNKPCTDCNIQYPSYCMQFDHARGNKEFHVSCAWTFSLEKIQKEIDKCDVVCANCHAIRTHKRKALTK
jgi:hypothetical protein